MRGNRGIAKCQSSVDELLGNSKDEAFPSSNEAPQAKNTKYLLKKYQNGVLESHSGRNILRNTKDEDFSSPKMFVNT